MDDYEMIIWEDMGNGSYEAWEPSITLGPDDDDTPVDFDSLMPTVCEDIESWPRIVIV